MNATAPRLHVFTSAAVNYLPKVRALCRSIRQHHPEAVIHFALADERPSWLTTQGEPFDSIVELPQLGIPEWRAWTFYHSIVELSTAIKPFVLKHLLAREDCSQVLYFDPDMVLFSRVDDILESLAPANVVLTPHQTTPESTKASVIDNEITSLRVGVFNLGFIGVRNTPEGRKFAEWWAQRCYDFCRAEVHYGLFTDQKWINFAPIFFDGVTILKSPRLNVATWNLTTRRMQGSVAEGFKVDGLPLAFYHFTGFDSGAHRIMAIKNASGQPAVQELIAWYERETQPERDDPVVRTPWAFGQFQDGTKIEPQHRWLYRERRDLQLAFPDPYRVDSPRLTFLEWCDTEGRIRYPEYFTKGKHAHASFPATHSGVSPAMAMHLLGLMFQPKAGKALRARLVQMIR
ncbi:MAG TPA: glycosyl transferase, partial [Usitatibacter sp.]|nr:glycosyl transferase [Usitatibacter sp.]